MRGAGRWDAFRSGVSGQEGGEGAAGSGRRQVLAMEIAGLRDDWQ